MKKKIAIICVFLLTVATISSNALSVTQTVKEKTSETCTTIIVGKELSKTGNVIHAHNEDLWFDTAQNLKVEKGKSVKPQSMEKFFYTSQPYGVSKTLSFMGSFNFNATDVPGDLGLGINEKGILITTNTGHARSEEIVKQDAPFVYSDFIRYALERATTAEEGVQLIADSLEKHGMSGDPGMMFFITDSNEAWLLECTPLHWAAVRCPDNGYIARANQYGITDAGDIRSDDLIQDAIDRGWYSPEDESHPEVGFNFREVYGDKDWNDGKYMNYNKIREDFIMDFMANKLSNGGKISAQDMMALLRSHFEETENEATPPHARQNSVDYTGNDVKRTICTARTVISLIGEQDSSLPEGLANKLWVAFPAPCTTGYFPVYLSHINADFPIVYANARKDGTPTPKDNAWWAYAQLISSIDKDYQKRAPVARQAYNAFEQDIFKEITSIESDVKSLYNNGKIAEANTMLNNYTDKKAIDSFELAKELYVKVEKMPQN